MKKTSLPVGVIIIIITILLFVTSSGCAILGAEKSTAEPQIEIITPENKATIDWQEEIGGTAKNIPYNQKIWILAYSGDEKQYYPLAEVVPKDGEWVTAVNIGFEKDYNKKYDIITVLPDKIDQNRFITHLFNATTEENIHSQGLFSLQEGTKEYDRITVTREDTRSGIQRLME